MKQSIKSLRLNHFCFLLACLFVFFVCLSVLQARKTRKAIFYIKNEISEYVWTILIFHI